MFDELEQDKQKAAEARKALERLAAKAEAAGNEQDQFIFRLGVKVCDLSESNSTLMQAVCLLVDQNKMLNQRLVRLEEQLSVLTG